MKIERTRKLVLGAMIVAFFGVLSLFNTYTAGMIDVLLCFVLVIPMAWYSYHYKLRDSLTVGFAATCLILIVGVPYFIISSLSSILVGIFIGEALKRELGKMSILCGVFLIYLLNNIVLFEVLSGLVGIDLVTDMRDMYEGIIRIAPELAQAFTVEMMLSLIPLMLILVSVLEMYISVMFCQILLTRLGVVFPGQFHLAAMHISQKYGMMLTGVLIVTYILKSFVQLDFIVFEYVSVIVLFVFALQGLSLAMFYSIMKQKRSFIFIACLLFIIPGTQVVFIILGILDIFSALRQKILYNRDTNE